VDFFLLSLLLLPCVDFAATPNPKGTSDIENITTPAFLVEYMMVSQ